MAIISVTSLKWGVWKSTITTNLAVAFAHMGYQVAIADSDVNGSCLKRSELRPSHLPTVSVFGLPTIEALKKNIGALAEKFEVVFIDGTPAISELVTTILLISDLTLLPLRASGLDLWAANKMIQFYEQAALTKQIQAYTLLNMAEPKTNFNAEAKEAMTALNLPVLASSLQNRVAYAEVVPQGLGVLEYTNMKAQQEIITLANEVKALIKSKKK